MCSKLERGYKANDVIQQVNDSVKLDTALPSYIPISVSFHLSDMYCVSTEVWLLDYMQIKVFVLTYAQLSVLRGAT